MRFRNQLEHSKMRLDHNRFRNQLVHNMMAHRHIRRRIRRCCD